MANQIHSYTHACALQGMGKLGCALHLPKIQWKRAWGQRKKTNIRKKGGHMVALIKSDKVL